MARTIFSDVTFTLDTSAYHANDVLADTQEVPYAVRHDGARGVLQSIVLRDKDDQTAAGMSVVFFRANVSLGTENSAPSISDANADNIIGIVAIASGDWVDLGGVKVATKSNINLPVRAASGTASIYVALICAGTPTQTASGITGTFGIVCD